MIFDSKGFLLSLSSDPGVYCMRDQSNDVLYVGKAKNLKKRLHSYFRPQGSARLQQLVSKIASIDVTVTGSEKEALLLEISLIKSLKPRYNVIFRDDKSFPYLFLSEHEYPRLIYFRGKSKEKGKYFGPYPSTAAVRETLSTLQKLFKLRQCDDHFFRHRQRPCLQYEIQRCSAPCTRYITQSDYSQSVEEAILFLSGKQTAILDKLVNKMEKYSENHDFEEASVCRDRIIRLRDVFDQQRIYHGKGNADVIAAVKEREHICIYILTVRQGQVIDSQAFFPKQGEGEETAEALRGFILQLYSHREQDLPRELIVNQPIEDRGVIEQMITERVNQKLSIVLPRQGIKLKWLTLAQENAVQALARRQRGSSAAQLQWQELKKTLGWEGELRRIECFDVSHTQGKETVASCIVFEGGLPIKSEYRRYGLEDSGGDDYGAMLSVLEKRYLKRKVENLVLPEIVMVDGGKGQLHIAKRALLECQLVETLIIAIAKGEGRKPGLETLYATRVQGEEEWVIHLSPVSKAFHLLQHIRDESHRFALGGHRQKRGRRMRRSTLEDIQGIGPKRRQALLNYFGGFQGLMQASVEAISKVPGISMALAKAIYDILHKDS